MQEKDSLHLLDRLAAIQDPRKDKGKRHPLNSILCGAIPQIMAALRNAAIAVLRFAGVDRIADEIKYLASKPQLAVNYITDVF